MRILQLHTRYRQRGGEDVVVDGEAELLRGAGHQVRQVVAQNPDTPLASIRALAASPWNPAWTRRVAREVADFKPDVAHIHNTWFAMSPAVIRTLSHAGVPVVMTLHNYRLTCGNALLFRDAAICEECVGARPWKAVGYACYRDSRAQSAIAAANLALHQRLRTWVDGVDLFIALTEFQKDLMVRAGLPEERITVKPNFVPDPGPRSAPPSASSSVLYVGRLSVEKGIDLLLDAWAEANTGDLELLIVGDGPMREVLEARSSRGVRFLGLRDSREVQDLMGTARAGVVPSRWYETFGMVCIESLAAGTPSIVSHQHVLAALVSRSLGSAWAAGTVDQWADSLGLLRDADHCDGAGQTARELFEQQFSIESSFAPLESIYARASAGNAH